MNYLINLPLIYLELNLCPSIEVDTGMEKDVCSILKQDKSILDYWIKLFLFVIIIAKRRRMKFPCRSKGRQALISTPQTSKRHHCRFSSTGSLCRQMTRFQASPKRFPKGREKSKARPGSSESMRDPCAPQYPSGSWWQSPQRIHR